MKNYRIIFWVSTSLIFISQGVMPALTGNAEMAKEGMRQLGYPEYFGMALTIFKVLGALALIIRAVPERVKEWAYPGFTFDFIFAAISHGAVDGLRFEAFFPFIVLGVLFLSYYSFHKLQRDSEVGNAR